MPLRGDAAAEARERKSAGRNTVDPDASQAVPPPRSLPRARIERAGLRDWELRRLDEGEYKASWLPPRT